MNDGREAGRCGLLHMAEEKDALRADERAPPANAPRARRDNDLRTAAAADLQLDVFMKCQAV